MDRLERYRVFIRVAQMGSFIKAANALALPRASVSAAVQRLESELGARLLHRTTRCVQLTADGALLFERALALLASAEDIDQLFQEQQHSVRGRLHVDLPSRIARRLVAPALPHLLELHPNLQLLLGSSDRAIDLVREGVDCVLRVGPLTESSLAARPLGNIELINCASPTYLQRHGTPQQIEDLVQGHWMVGYASPLSGREQPWEFLDASGRTHNLTLPSRVLVNNAENYIACCQAGLGLIQVPRFDVQDLLSAGELREVMPQLRAAPLPATLLYPHRLQRSGVLSLFANWLEALLAPCLE
ncbi:LysR family transcriptional regulator [Pseudomonas guariconensis]|uniref:LysR family transcriptional regulator n=1 Tax=Pseudomonas guariconensis TaxID=1288410 RepID=UPI0018AB42DD|nr:LysR family transcriptional regulator [Pseudomonas guariconensis]MBF8739574.1 LysR family transcriptional regulator [Pseudomonas guariconensis]MBF8749977.1 LysR family transcriptional regulator [Pseudomonas guariconensis]